MKRISIEELKQNLKDKKIRLHLDTKATVSYGDPIITPIHCYMQFDTVIVNEMFPPNIKFNSVGGTIKLSRIRKILRDENADVTIYVIWCGGSEENPTHLALIEVL